MSHSFLFLGDSYTIGEGVSESDSFPGQLISILKKEGLNIDVVRVIAKTGWTTDELQSAIDNADLQPEYDFVTLLIGVNNQYRGRPVDDYLPEFESLLRQAIAFAQGRTNRVAVISIPDWSVTPFASMPKDDGSMQDRKRARLEIDKYNKGNEDIAKKYGVHYLPITEGTREAENDNSLLTTDLLHPSAKEYARWATRLASIIKLDAGMRPAPM